jgi:hypothetical protein
MELISQLVESLGISEEQATGGAGALFNMAKSALGEGDFSQITDAIPDVSSLLDSAPEAGGGGLLGAVGSMASSLGIGGDKVSGLASLAGNFSNLDMDAGMIGKCGPVVLNYVKSMGGDTVSSLLENIFSD